MNWLRRKYRLLKLKCRAYILEAEAEHAEALIADHNQRYRITLVELGQVRRRIIALEEPEVLLRKTA